MKDEDWQAVIDVNLDGRLPPERGALSGMMQAALGRIVSITSIVGVTGNPGQANYAAAKAGMIGMSKALAPGGRRRDITVNCVAPGFIETRDDRRAQREAARGDPARPIPAGRLGSGRRRRRGRASIWPATRPAYVTGQTLHVNGGMAMI